MSKLMSRRPVTDLVVDIVDGARWSLADAKPQRFTLLVFYRGLHCPLCRTYLAELNRLSGEFRERGVEIIVTSTDSEERARRAKAEWGLGNLTVGYGLSVEKAREWGLYISSGRGKTSTGVEEPALFSEPGIFLILPDKTLYWAAVQTMPFARPHFKDVLAGLDFVIKVEYPARGEA